MVLKIHGEKSLHHIIPLFEKYLRGPMPKTTLEDRKRELIIILLGEAARFLGNDTAKMTTILKMLLNNVRAPSELVQQAIAECISALIKASKDEAPTLIQHQLKQLFSADSYAQRRGSAFALAGIVKGMGIGALKEFNIVATLKEAIGDRRSPRRREGALLLLETFALILGRLFEPYVVQILPQLLGCFSDTNEEVRRTTSDASRAIMSRLSAHCVKLILPSLFSGLEDDKQWRTKQGSIEMLGAMAHLAPMQLSTCLPAIVPRLMEVLTDSHVQVQESARQALVQIGSVIKNPEIQQLLPIIIAALCDPLSKHQELTLDRLLSTRFVHLIDAPSLALIVPVISRALQERSSDIKKKAAHIVVNICSLTDVEDMRSYTAMLYPQLKELLLDPIPEVRAISSKALGMLVARVHEYGSENLISWLTQRLRSDTSSVDRSGAAQGLSEVIAALGVDKLQSLLPEIIRECSSDKPHVREGSLLLLLYLPTSLHSKFQPFIDKAIPCFLLGLADEIEFVRAVALKGAQMIIQNFAKSSVDILLPKLCKGLFDDEWRIRLSSVQLLGTLLGTIIGTSEKTQLDENENEILGTEETDSAIVMALGQERRNQVLAALYIVRSDVHPMVRQASLQVWKAVVSNTPRTIKEVLLDMVDLIIDCLAAENFDQQRMGAHTLADIVQKLGDRVLPEILPTMKRHLETDDVNGRRGICIGLCEILASTDQKTMLSYHSNSIVRCVKLALCDDDNEVRKIAAHGFDQLFRQIGERAVHDILPDMLEELSLSSDDTVLRGLRELSSVCNVIVLNTILPQLLHVPISESNARALSVLIPVAGPALVKHLPNIMASFFACFEHNGKQPNESMTTAMQNAMNATKSDEAIRNLMTTLLESLHSNFPHIRQGASYLLHLLFQDPRPDLSTYVPSIINALLKLYCDENAVVLECSIQALDSLFKSLRKEDLVNYASQVGRSLHSNIGKCKDRLSILPGLGLSKVVWCSTERHAKQ